MYDGVKPAGSAVCTKTIASFRRAMAGVSRLPGQIVSDFNETGTVRKLGMSAFQSDASWVPTALQSDAS